MSGSNSDADLRDSDVAERLVASYAAESPLSITAGHELPSPREVHAAPIPGCAEGRGVPLFQNRHRNRQCPRFVQCEADNQAP